MHKKKTIEQPVKSTYQTYEVWIPPVSEREYYIKGECIGKVQATSFVEACRKAITENPHYDIRHYRKDSYYGIQLLPYNPLN